MGHRQTHANLGSLGMSAVKSFGILVEGTRGGGRLSPGSPKSPTSRGIAGSESHPVGGDRVIRPSRHRDIGTSRHRDIGKAKPHRRGAAVPHGHSNPESQVGDRDHSPCSGFIEKSLTRGFAGTVLPGPVEILWPARFLPGLSGSGECRGTRGCWPGRHRPEK